MLVLESKFVVDEPSFWVALYILIPAVTPSCLLSWEKLEAVKHKIMPTAANNNRFFIQASLFFFWVWKTYQCFCFTLSMGSASSPTIISRSFSCLCIFRFDSI
jgi:hypothetical protein